MQRLQADHDADEFLLFSTRYDNLHGRHIELRDRAMGSTTMRRWFKACIEQAKLPDFPMHELRHTAGTQFHLAGGDIAATQKFMRHASPSTTRDHYVHLDTGHIIDA